MGYSYIDGLNEIDELKTFSAISPGAWGLLSETFTIPNNISADISFKIVITYTEDAVPGAQYNFFATAFSAGQYGEDANSVSVGASKELIPSNIAISQTHGIKIRNYGLDSNDGYFIVDNDILYARNYGMPMVFGKNFGTTVYDNPNGPSIIVPGLGFLNKVGQHRDMTLEAWIKIDAKTTTPKRIIGPIASTDGLYVDCPFLPLKIGNNIGSHFIYEWGRPMLIDIRIVKNFASLLINGEQVISLSITTDTLDLPDQYDNYFSPTKMEQDWIGIYSHSDITLFKIDAIAIYPYQVSEIIAKRRFVYGQGVDFPESIRSSASGSTIYVDYPFADYTNNYSYPSIGEWNQGISENIRVNNTVLSSPNYSLPQVFIEQKRTSITGLASTSSTIIFNGNNSFEVGDLINITGLVVNDTNSSAYNLSNAEIISANTTEFEVSNTTGIVANYSSGGTATAVVAQTIDDLLLELGNMQTSATDKYISLTPSNSWSNTNAYILFNSLNLI